MCRKYEIMGGDSNNSADDMDNVSGSEDRGFAYNLIEKFGFDKAIALLGQYSIEKQSTARTQYLPRVVTIQEFYYKFEKIEKYFKNERYLSKNEKKKIEAREMSDATFEKAQRQADEEELEGKRIKRKSNKIIKAFKSYSGGMGYINSDRAFSVKHLAKEYDTKEVVSIIKKYFSKKKKSFRNKKKFFPTVRTIDEFCFKYKIIRDYFKIPDSEKNSKKDEQGNTYLYIHKFSEELWDKWYYDE